MDGLSNNIRSIILEMLDEERITNTAASLEVQQRKNFVGSHTYGENIGDLDKMYVAYSYGEQHPLYVWVGEEGDGGIWYYNHDDYILPNGKPNIWTRKHLRDLKPNAEVQGRPGSVLKKKIEEFKAKYGIKDSDNAHTDLQPGEK